MFSFLIFAIIIMPWGPTMLSGLLNNRSELVKEYAIELVENWADVSTLLSIYRENSVRSELIPKLQKRDVKKYISEVKQKGLINEELTNPDLLKDINKYCFAE